MEGLGGCVYLEVNLSHGGDAVQLGFMHHSLVPFGWFLYPAEDPAHVHPDVRREDEASAWHLQLKAFKSHHTLLHFHAHLNLLTAATRFLQ